MPLHVRPVRSTGRHERVLGRKGKHEGEGGPFVAPAKRISFPLVTISPVLHLAMQKAAVPQGDSGFFNSAGPSFPRENYFQRLLYLTERPSVRSTSRLTRASISS